MSALPQQTPIDPRLKIAALWTSVLLIFAYVDIFSLFRRDVLESVMAQQIAGMQIGQGFLLGTTIYILVPCLMVPLSVLLAPRANRWANVILAPLYALSIAASCIGEVWMYYWVGSAVEVLLLGIIVQLAWTMER